MISVKSNDAIINLFELYINENSEDRFISNWQFQFELEVKVIREGLWFRDGDRSKQLVRPHYLEPNL